MGTGTGSQGGTGGVGMGMGPGYGGLPGGLAGVGYGGQAAKSDSMNVGGSTHGMTSGPMPMPTPPVPPWLPVPVPIVLSPYRPDGVFCSSVARRFALDWLSPPGCWAYHDAL